MNESGLPYLFLPLKAAGKHWVLGVFHLVSLQISSSNRYCWGGCREVTATITCLQSCRKVTTYQLELLNLYSRPLGIWSFHIGSRGSSWVCANETMQCQSETLTVNYKTTLCHSQRLVAAYKTIHCRSETWQPLTWLLSVDLEDCRQN